jgi:hypothetical protein
MWHAWERLEIQAKFELACLNLRARLEEVSVEGMIILKLI